jgi:hypothetical protein
LVSLVSFSPPFDQTGLALVFRVGTLPTRLETQEETMPTRWTKRGKWAAYLLLAALALGSSGCLAAVVGGVAAAGTATGVFYVEGQLSHTYSAYPDDVWKATRTALAELNMFVKKEDRSDNGGGFILTQTTSDSVKITLEVKESKIPSEGPLTTVGIRVGTFGDKEVSNRILEQISSHLRPAPRVAPAPVPNLGPPQVQPVGAGPVILAPRPETPPPPLAPKG